MTDNNRDPLDQVAEEFWTEIEKEAARLEITCDYYLAEFYAS
tara:strand:+ start:1330 stop:1455 length:126 start_codon:yes stop_codon:yes gene_type:complete